MYHQIVRFLSDHALGIGLIVIIGAVLLLIGWSMLANSEQNGPRGPNEYH